jgi:SPFH domain / Band 7 family
MAAAIILMLAFAAATATLVLRLHTGSPSSFALLPYQRGILYKRGLPLRDVGPGKHRVRIGLEKIVFLDVRPVQVNFENRAVALQDGVTAVYGFSGSAEVRDVRKALYCAVNYTHVPAFILLCSARSVLNSYSSGQLRFNKETVTSEITSRAKSRLAANGFQLLGFQFTQLSIAPLAQQHPGSSLI